MNIWNSETIFLTLLLFLLLFLFLEFTHEYMSFAEMVIDIELIQDIYHRPSIRP